MISLSELLGGRPEKRRYDPPADKPLDQTHGAVPPYDFPPELARALAGKSEEEVSSLLSKFRTGLSEHRTRLSEHRTDLSEHRTDLSDYRTELSHARTEMSEHRTKLSNDRSHLSNERTHLSYVRTAVSLMSFGITINRFAVFLAEGKGYDDRIATRRMWSTEQFGLGMVVVGIILLIWSLFRYRAIHAQLLSQEFRPPAVSVLLLTLAIIALGAVSSVILITVK
ncbi:MAG: DUF202 domain-containing protein [Sphingomonas sp.]|nr:DUF202 domain-containing protein [Sphingomonas sp.]MDX3885337.1 DUF202 domain-containing protein [Sphingomonas sp.]